ncbi:MAG: hypothetical protein IPM18_06200 [Phycisphaerales bacterium]|nr:hypothetical protein [Phycisphaerales bacterium]
MAADEETFAACEACGATIYPEHVKQQTAGSFEGRMLCPHCLRERRGESAMGTPALLSGDEPLNAERKPTPILSFGSGLPGLGAGSAEATKYRRPLLKGSPHATRCRTFHCKLADGPLVHMNQQINEWVDSDDDIEIKFATSTIGVVEGKHSDPHLIVTLFY